MSDFPSICWEKKRQCMTFGRSVDCILLKFSSASLRSNALASSFEGHCGKCSGGFALMHLDASDESNDLFLYSIECGLVMLGRNEVYHLENKGSLTDLGKWKAVKASYSDREIKLKLDTIQTKVPFEPTNSVSDARNSGHVKQTSFKFKPEVGIIIRKNDEQKLLVIWNCDLGEVLCFAEDTVEDFEILDQVKFTCSVVVDRKRGNRFSAFMADSVTHCNIQHNFKFKKLVFAASAKVLFVDNYVMAVTKDHWHIFLLNDDKSPIRPGKSGLTEGSEIHVAYTKLLTHKGEYFVSVFHSDDEYYEEAFVEIAKKKKLPDDLFDEERKSKCHCSLIFDHSDRYQKLWTRYSAAFNPWDIDKDIDDFFLTYSDLLLTGSTVSYSSSTSGSGTSSPISSDNLTTESIEIFDGGEDTAETLVVDMKMKFVDDTSNSLPQEVIPDVLKTITPAEEQVDQKKNEAPVPVPPRHSDIAVRADDAAPKQSEQQMHNADVDSKRAAEMRNRTETVPPDLRVKEEVPEEVRVEISSSSLRRQEVNTEANIVLERKEMLPQSYGSSSVTLPQYSTVKEKHAVTVRTERVLPLVKPIPPVTSKIEEVSRLSKMASERNSTTSTQAETPRMTSRLIDENTDPGRRETKTVADPTTTEGIQSRSSSAQSEAYHSSSAQSEAFYSAQSSPVVQRRLAAVVRDSSSREQSVSPHNPLEEQARSVPFVQFEEANRDLSTSAELEAAAKLEADRREILEKIKSTQAKMIANETRPQASVFMKDRSEMVREYHKKTLYQKKPQKDNRTFPQQQYKFGFDSSSSAGRGAAHTHSHTRGGNNSTGTSRGEPPMFNHRGGRRNHLQKSQEMFGDDSPPARDLHQHSQQPPRGGGFGVANDRRHMPRPESVNLDPRNDGVSRPRSTFEEYNRGFQPSWHEDFNRGFQSTANPTLDPAGAVGDLNPERTRHSAGSQPQLFDDSRDRRDYRAPPSLSTTANSQQLRVDASSPLSEGEAHKVYAIIDSESEKLVSRDSVVSRRLVRAIASDRRSWEMVKRTDAWKAKALLTLAQSVFIAEHHRIWYDSGLRRPEDIELNSIGEFYRICLEERLCEWLLSESGGLWESLFMRHRRECLEYRQLKRGYSGNW